MECFCIHTFLHWHSMIYPSSFRDDMIRVYEAMKRGRISGNEIYGFESRSLRILSFWEPSLYWGCVQMNVLTAGTPVGVNDSMVKWIKNNLVDKTRGIKKTFGKVYDLSACNRLASPLDDLSLFSTSIQSKTSCSALGTEKKADWIMYTFGDIWTSLSQGSRVISGSCDDIAKT